GPNGSGSDGTGRGENTPAVCGTAAWTAGAGLASAIAALSPPARRRLTNAVAIVFSPARSTRIESRWHRAPSWTAPTAAATVPAPHSGFPGCSTRSPIWNLSSVVVGMRDVLSRKAGRYARVGACRRDPAGLDPAPGLRFALAPSDRPRGRSPQGPATAGPADPKVLPGFPGHRPGSVGRRNEPNRRRKPGRATGRDTETPGIRSKASRAGPRPWR